MAFLAQLDAVSEKDAVWPVMSVESKRAAMAANSALVTGASGRKCRPGSP
jgi:hypothetical protein